MQKRKVFIKWNPSRFVSVSNREVWVRKLFSYFSTYIQQWFIYNSSQSSIWSIFSFTYLVLNFILRVGNTMEFNILFKYEKISLMFNKSILVQLNYAVTPSVKELQLSEICSSSKPPNKVLMFRNIDTNVAILVICF